MTASTLARNTDTTVFTIRYYTKIGLLRPTRNPANGYRSYDRSDTERIRFINAAKRLGFTLQEIGSILAHASGSKSPCPMVREIVDKKINENRSRIREMQRLQKRLEKAADDWKSMEDSVPDGHSVCRLIESFAEYGETV